MAIRLDWKRFASAGIEEGKLNVTVHSNTSFTVYWKDDLIKTYVCFSVEWMRKRHKAAAKSFHQKDNNWNTLPSLQGRYIHGHVLVSPDLRVTHLDYQVFNKNVVAGLIMFSGVFSFFKWRRWNILCIDEGSHPEPPRIRWQDYFG